MRLTTKGRYAVTAMLDLALYGQGKTVSLSDISERQDISLAYLEQLFASLRKRGLLDSVRGPGGGYRLSRDSDDISVAAVIDAVEESIDATRCHGAKNCHGDQPCLTHDLWEDLSHAIHGFLNDVSLGELVRRHAQRAAPGAPQRVRDMRRRSEPPTILPG